MEQFLDYASKHGFLTVIFAGILLGIALNYKQIVDWLWATIRAAAIIQSHEETIQELKAEVQQLREKLEEYNAILVKQSETIARLEERIVQTATKRVKSKLEDEE